jgi:hypothetical protein
MRGLREESQGSNSGTSVTHDSDPRPLKFLALSQDPANLTGDGVIESDLGIELDMTHVVPLGTSHGGSPGVEGPTLADITGGTDPGSTSATKVSEMTGGTGGHIDITITYTDTSTTSFSLVAAVMAGASTSGTNIDDINLLTAGVVDLTADEGKIVSEVSYHNASPGYTTSNPAGLVQGSSSMTLYLQSQGTPFFAEAIIAGSGGSVGPTIGYVVQPGDYIRAHFVIVSNVVPTANKVIFDVEDPASIARAQDLTAGDWGVKLTLDDASTIECPFYGFEKMQVDGGSLSTWTVPLINEGALIIPAGKSVVSVDFTLNGDITHSNPSFTSLFVKFGVAADIHTSRNDNLFGTFSTMDPPHTVGSTQTYAPTDSPIAFDRTLTYTGQINYNPDLTHIELDVDAAAILASPASPSLAVQDGYSLIGNATMLPYVGWKAQNIQFVGNGAYDVGAHGPIGASSTIVVGFIGSFGFDVTTLDPINPTLTASGPPPGAEPLISSDGRVQLHINLFPKSVAPTPATYDPVVITEEYEIRLRNQAAIRLVFTPPEDWTGEDPPTVVARCYVSQGSHPNEIRYWTPAPICIFDESAASTPGNSVVIDMFSHMSGMPDAYGGTIIALPTESFRGPWNYLRILLMPPTVGEGGSLPDYTGWTLKAFANAREI